MLHSELKDKRWNDMTSDQKSNYKRSRRVHIRERIFNINNKPLRDDSAMRALSSLRGMGVAPEAPTLCRETSVSRTANVGTVGMNGLRKKSRKVKANSARVSRHDPYCRSIFQNSKITPVNHSKNYNEEFYLYCNFYFSQSHHTIILYFGGV